MPGFLETLKQKFFTNSSAANQKQDRLEVLDKSVQQSFTNLRKDMEHISKLLHYFNSTNQKQAKQLLLLEKRMKSVEFSICKASGEELAEIEENEEAAGRTSSNMDDETVWETLTESQQKLCWKLAALQKEMPDQWISLKYLAQELYPDKEYGAIRSTLSQFVSALEEMGFVKRKRKGKQAYIISTKSNPCIHKKMPIVQVEKSKIKSKKL